MSRSTIELSDLCSSCRKLPYGDTGMSVEDAFEWIQIPNNPAIRWGVNQSLAAMLNSAIAQGYGCARCKDTVKNWANLFLR